MLFPIPDAARQAGVVAATQRWLERAVIGLDLCPFARAVHARGRIRWAVTAADTEADLLAELRREMDVLAAADPDAVDTTLLIHPQVLADFTDYRFFLAKADTAVRKGGHAGTLQVASFHPHYEFGDAAPNDVANCTNRSPYPMLHLLREASVGRAVAAFPDAASIYGRNVETLRRLGHDGWKRLLAPGGN
jgi:hypothetical protein